MTSNQLNLFVIRGFVTLLVIGGMFATLRPLTQEGQVLESTQHLLFVFPLYVLMLRYGLTGRAGVMRWPGQWWRVAYGGCLAGVALSLLLIGGRNGFEKMASLIALLGGLAVIAYALFARPRTPSVA